MKKAKVLLLTASALLAMSFPSAADPSITQIRTLPDADWVDGSNLLRLRGDNGYYVADLEGNALSDDSYSSFYFSNGYITAQSRDEEVNSTGLMTDQGELIIDCRYGDLKIPGSRWAIGYVLTPADANSYDYESWFAGEDDDKYFLIETEDIYHLDGNIATQVASIPREHIMDTNAYGDYLAVEDRSDGSVTLYDASWNVAQEDLSSVYADPEIPAEGYQVFSENGQQGIKDSDGTVTAAPAYRYIYSIRHGYANASTGDQDGLIDLYGNVIVPVEMDKIFANYYAPTQTDGDDSAPYTAGNYAAFEQDGKVGYYDLSGSLTMEPTYSSDILEVNGASAVLTDLEGNVHILAADGVDTVLDDAHKDIRALYYGNGYLYSFRDENYNCGVIDWHGNELLPLSYGSATLSGDGQYLLAEVDYDSAELYQVTYDALIAPASGQAAEAAEEVQTESVE